MFIVKISLAASLAVAADVAQAAVDAGQLGADVLRAAARRAALC